MSLNDMYKVILKYLLLALNHLSEFGDFNEDDEKLIKKNNQDQIFPNDYIQVPFVFLFDFYCFLIQDGHLFENSPII